MKSIGARAVADRAGVAATGLLEGARRSDAPRPGSRRRRRRRPEAGRRRGASTTARAPRGRVGAARGAADEGAPAARAWCASAGIKTAPAASDSLPATVDLTGEIAADPDKSARLAARVPGRIVEVKVKEGDRVKAGQTVAVLESPELARARATLASAVARAKVGAAQRRPAQEPGGEVAGLRPGGRPRRRRRPRRSTPRSRRPGRRCRRSGRARTRRTGGSARVDHPDAARRLRPQPRRRPGPDASTPSTSSPSSAISSTSTSSAACSRRTSRA